MIAWLHDDDDDDDDDEEDDDDDDDDVAVAVPPNKSFKSSRTSQDLVNWNLNDIMPGMM